MRVIRAVQVAYYHQYRHVMVAYKSDPLGLNETVTPGSNRLNHKKSGFRHWANRLTVKKAKGRDALPAVYDTPTTTRSIQQLPAAAHSTPLFKIVDKPRAISTQDTLVDSPRIERAETMEPLVSSTATALYSDAAIITDLGRLPQSNQEGNDIAVTNTDLLKIPKILKRFSRCCFRPNEVAANEKVLVRLSLVSHTFGLNYVDYSLSLFVSGSQSIIK